MRESLGVRFGVEVCSYLGLPDVCVERKLDGSLVEFYRDIMGMHALVENSVAVAEVVARASALRS